jgi:hypothetical protein
MHEQPGKLDRMYQRWREAHLKANGDRHLSLVLRHVPGLSERASRAQATVKFDITAQTVEAEATGLDEPTRLWAVDNVPGPGKNVSPQDGDRFLLLGEFSPQGDGSAKIWRRVVEGMRAFELDLVVMSTGDGPPIASGISFGTFSLFQRLRLREVREKGKVR